MLLLLKTLTIGFHLEAIVTWTGHLPPSPPSKSKCVLSQRSSGTITNNFGPEQWPSARLNCDMSMARRAEIEALDFRLPQNRRYIHACMHAYIHTYIYYSALSDPSFPSPGPCRRSSTRALVEYLLQGQRPRSGPGNN